MRRLVRNIAEVEVTLVLVLLLLLAIFTVPAWPYSRNWGYYPSGGLGLVAVVLLAVMLLR